MALKCPYAPLRRPGTTVELWVLHQQTTVKVTPPETLCGRVVSPVLFGHNVFVFGCGGGRVQVGVLQQFDVIWVDMAFRQHEQAKYVDILFTGW